MTLVSAMRLKSFCNRSPSAACIAHQRTETGHHARHALASISDTFTALEKHLCGAALTQQRAHQTELGAHRSRTKSPMQHQTRRACTQPDNTVPWLEVALITAGSACTSTASGH